MKKFLFLVTLALMPFIFASCSSDEDESRDTGNIQGAWLEKAYWKEESGSFYYPGDYYSDKHGRIHVFMPDGKYLKYYDPEDFKTGIVKEEGTYSFDGTYLVIDGGYKRKIIFTEDGRVFEWEKTAIVVKY